MKEIVRTEAEQWIGCGMTYSLFECLKEKIDDILVNLTSESLNQSIDVTADDLQKLDVSDKQSGAKAPKKEQLTKSQKRRMWDKTDHTGAKARGWNWIDIIKHLSQTGYKDEPISEANS